MCQQYFPGLFGRRKERQKRGAIKMPDDEYHHGISENTPLNQKTQEGDEMAQCSKSTEEDYGEMINATPPPSPVNFEAENSVFQDEPECYLCGNRRYRNSSALPHEKRYVKPCQCESKYAHHGCLMVLFPQGMGCSKCLTKYRYYVYGSYKDFLRRYWYQFLFVFLICVFLILIGAYAIYFGLKGSNFRHLVLLSLGTAAITFSLFLLAKFLIAKFCKHYPKFKKRYGNVMIVDCKIPPAERRLLPKGLTEMDRIYCHLTALNEEASGKRREKDGISFESLGSLTSREERGQDSGDDDISYSSVEDVPLDPR